VIRTATWGGISVLDIADADSPHLVGALPLPHFEKVDFQRHRYRDSNPGFRTENPFWDVS
jgi:hypothetical protein